MACCFVHRLHAEDGITCALEVYQFDSTRQQNVLQYADTAQFVRDIPASGFILFFSIELHFTQVDSNRSSFTVHLVTLGTQAQTYSRSFTVEHGLPARIDITGKKAAPYTLVIRPLTMIDIDTTACAFNHRVKGTFRFDPTAHMDIYFVVNSLGDFYWDAVKDLFERQYRLFKNLFNLNLPGKYYIYLCPCPIASVLWDDRFGMAVDPTSRTTYAVFNKQVNSADPFLVIHTALLRTFGYAPPFLSEGWAGYTSFAVFDMKKLLQEDRVPPLSQLLNTYQYFQTDAQVADRVAATFVKYLIDQYSITRFKTLYDSTDDLNLLDKIEKVYGKGIDVLESEWKQYVDTVTISLEHYIVYAQQAEQMLDYPRMLEYAQEYVKQSVTARDSLKALALLAKASFFTGEYYKATSAQEALTRLDTTSARNWMTLAAYKMMNGYYDNARSDLLTALAQDSTDYFVKFNLALNYMIMGNKEEAGKLLLDLVVNPAPKGGLGGEARIMLANLLNNSKDSIDKALAVTYYNEAISIFERELKIHQASPTAYLWMGIAFLGLGDTGNASDYLQTALFLETRPFYIGMINLWLGKVADVLQDRTAARSFYARVLELPSAHYHQEEAKKYLDEPFRQ
ncbi:MAG: tetratricopeptide repeat protein [Candidatus Zixiibacteriota bacterium]